MYLPFVLPRWAIPSPRLDALLVEPPEENLAAGLLRTFPPRFINGMFWDPSWAVRPSPEDGPPGLDGAIGIALAGGTVPGCTAGWGVIMPVGSFDARLPLFPVTGYGFSGIGAVSGLSGIGAIGAGRVPALVGVPMLGLPGLGPVGFLAIMSACAIAFFALATSTGSISTGARLAG